MKLEAVASSAINDTKMEQRDEPVCLTIDLKIKRSNQLLLFWIENSIRTERIAVPEI